MKLLLFLALAFFCGIDGFAIFAPYAAFVVVLDLLIRRRRQNQEGQVLAALQPVEADEEFEIARA